MDGLTEGRIVHFVMNDGDHRAAIIARVWGKESGVVNLTVFTDWSNDIEGNGNEQLNEQIAKGILWRTAVQYSEDPKPNTWHWIERA